MGASVNNSSTRRRRMRIGTGLLLALAAQAPLSVAAATSGSSSTATSGLVTNVTKALTAHTVRAGDYISSGWTIRMPGNHPAATVQLTNIGATIPLACQVSGQPSRLVTLLIRMPDASQSFTANDTTWHPTPSANARQGYQASVIAGDLCHAGVLTPHGNVTYTAKLASTDTKDVFGVRFHTVDARTSTSHLNTDCAAPHNHRLAQCAAAWTVQTTSAAVAAPVGPGGGSGGTVTGTVGGVAASTGHLVTLPALLQPILHRATGSLRSHPTSGTTAPTSPAGAVSGVSTRAAPVMPSPSQSTVLSPVPLPVPVIDSVAAGVEGALPWGWFLLLAILDLGLILGIVIRRRVAPRDRLYRRRR